MPTVTTAETGLLTPHMPRLVLRWLNEEPERTARSIDGTVVFMRSFNPHDIVRRVREWRISVIVCVPMGIVVTRNARPLLSRVEVPSDFVPSVKTTCPVGVPAPPATVAGSVPARR